MGRYSGTLLIVLVAAASLSNYRSPGPQSQSAPEPAAAGKQLGSRTGTDETLVPCSNDSLPPAAYVGLWRTIHGYFGSHPENDPERSPDNVKFVIATVADPSHTRLSLVFDWEVDAIQQAGIAAGYEFDRAVLPWDSGSHPEGDDFRVRSQEDSWKNCREKFPGLLIFRPGENDQSLFVFLVGETPTSGVRREQFDYALGMMRSIRDWSIAKNIEEFHPAKWIPGDPLNQQLLVLGPTFSGSFDSLSSNLLQDRASIQQTPPIVVRSGSATSAKAIEEFGTDYLGVKRNFSSLQWDDSTVLEKFASYVRQQGYCLGQVAVLSEDETMYGTDSSDTPMRLESDMNGCSADPSVWSAYAQHILFPREISQLRAAYQKSELLDDASSEELKQRPRSTLRSNLAGGGHDDDTVPSFAGDMTALSQEAILLGIINNLEKYHPIFVVIRATDPSDQLFLVRFLKRRYPKGRIVILNSTLLLARDDVDDAEVRGVMSIGTYPELPGNWASIASSSSRSNAGKLVFPSYYSEGVFNAFLSLVTRNSSGPEPLGSSKLPLADYRDYGSSQLSGFHKPVNCRPPIWITALGRSDFWPVAAIQPDAGSLPEVEGQVKCSGDNPRYLPHTWLLLFSICLVAGAGHLYVVCKGSVVAPSGSLAKFAPILDIGERIPYRQTLISLGTAVVLASFLLVLVPPLPFFGGIGLVRKDYSLATLIVVTFVMLLASGCIVAVGYADYTRRHIKTNANYIILYSAIFVIAFAVSIWFLPDSQMGAHLSAIYRYVHPESGLSMAIPCLLLLAAVYWWVWMSLDGVSFLDRRRPRLPFIRRQTEVPTAQRSKGRGSVLHALSTATLLPFELASLSETGNRKLVRLAQPFKQDQRTWWIMASVLFVTMIAIGFSPPIQSLEGKWCDILYGFGCAFVIAVLLNSLVKVTLVWKELRKLLVALERMPIRLAFTRLKGFDWKPIWQAGANTVTVAYRNMSRELESLRHLLNSIAAGLLPAWKTRGVMAETAFETIAAQQGVKLKRLTDEYQVLVDRPEQYSENLLRPLFEGRSLQEFFSQKVADSRSDRMIREYEDLQFLLARACGAMMNFLAVTHWSKQTAPVSDATEEGACEKCGNDGTGDEAKRTETEAIRIAEEFVSLVYANFIVAILSRMRTMIFAIAGMFVLLVLSLSSYPFEPANTLRSLSVVLFVVIFAGVVLIYFGMHKDRLLSRLTNTEGKTFDGDFFLKTFSFGAIPFLGLLATQFPSVSRFLFSWIQPILDSARGH